MSHDQVDVSGAPLYWNSLWHHKTDIALSAGFYCTAWAATDPGARFHMPHELLPADMLTPGFERFGPGVRTWGEATVQRATKQHPPLPPTGTPVPPKLRTRKP